MNAAAVFLHLARRYPGHLALHFDLTVLSIPKTTQSHAVVLLQRPPYVTGSISLLGK